ncbi:MAG: Wzz/FepE/Etk N-terminal domain-containing protein [Pseudomonadota bacterium]
MAEQLVTINPDNDADQIRLFDLLTTLARYRWLVLGMPIAMGALALAFSSLLSPEYSSTVRLLPPQQQGSNVTAMLGQLGGLAGAASGIAGIKNPNDLYVGMLESRTVADNLIKRFGLKERYKKATMDETRNALTYAREIVNGKKDSIISISVQDEDPKFAADLANSFAEELARLTQTMALTEAAQRRLFFEKQMKEARDQLSAAEGALRSTQEKTGLVRPEAQVPVMISVLAQLKGTIAAKEVQLNSMRTFAAEQNPERLRTEEELRSLRAQLVRLEQSQNSRAGDTSLPLGKVPESGLEYLRAVRNVKYYETIFELLAKQFELAKIDEAKDSPLIQVLDKAIPAEKKTKPRRAIITLVGIIAGGMLGIVLTFMHSAYRRSRDNPAQRADWQALSLAWRGKPRKAVN